MVQAHGDVGPECFLDRHRPLGRQLEQAAVEVRPERHALVGDPVAVGQAEDLEPARIGEDRTVPAHERVQAAERLARPLRRAEGEVIGIRQQHPRAGRPELVGREPLTVACVPTGMNAGVSTVPCGVSRATPRSRHRNRGLDGLASVNRIRRTPARSPDYRSVDRRYPESRRSSIVLQFQAERR